MVHMNLSTGLESTQNHYFRSLNKDETCFIINHEPGTELTNYNLMFTHPKSCNDIELYVPYLIVIGLTLILDIAIYFRCKENHDHHTD